MLAVSPLTVRGQLAIADDVDADRVRRTALETLQAVASDEGLPLCFSGVEARDLEPRSALVTAGYAELFLFYDSVLELPEPGLEPYLARFRSDARRQLRRELEAPTKAGVRFEAVTDEPAQAEALAAMYHRTHLRHGGAHFAVTADYLRAVTRHLGPMATLLCARRGDDLLGFSLLLTKGETWLHRIGRSYDDDDGRAYFHLAFYEPIRRAGAAPRLWLGPSAYVGKHRRGAVGHALYSYLWFPRTRSRALLLPFLRFHAAMTQRQLAFAAAPTSGLRR